MIKKQTLLTIIALFTLIPTVIGQSAENGKITSKDEVVYASLSAIGELEKIYVVNTLDVPRAGELVDYGDYESVKNLTDLSELVQKDGTVHIQAPEGKFYYQGNMKDDANLPWNITVSYLLNGEVIKAAELADKSGHVEIQIETSANDMADSVFYENYILQISLILPNRYKNITASGGMIASAGKNKQITFTVMPGQDETHVVEADVENFEFQGIEIAAVPSTLPFDTAELDEMTGGMSTLSNAIAELNSGVAEFATGIAQLHDGVGELRNGSSQYQSGMEDMNEASSSIVEGSRTIRGALRLLRDSLAENASEPDLSGLTELPAGLTEFANVLTQSARELTALGETFSSNYRELGDAIGAIPKFSTEELAILEERLADPGLFNRVRSFYENAQTVKATYSRVKPVFDTVAPGLNEAAKGLRGLSGQLTATAENITNSLSGLEGNQLEELQTEVGALAANYGQYHSGLVDYTEGVKKISDSYKQIHSGIIDLTGGTEDLQKGVRDLHSGTKELAEETKNLPKQMQQEIHQAFKEYDKSDFTPVSFVSTKNKKVYSVQFVMRTKGIEREEQKQTKKEPAKEKTFWQRLKKLFS